MLHIGATWRSHVCQRRSTSLTPCPTAEKPDLVESVGKRRFDLFAPVATANGTTSFRPMGATEDELAAAVRRWLAEAWDPDITVREWWERLAQSGYGFPHWPTEWFGKSMSTLKPQLSERRWPPLGCWDRPSAWERRWLPPSFLRTGPRINVPVGSRRSPREGALVPVLQRARCRIRSGRRPDPGRQ